MLLVRPATPADIGAVDALLGRSYGPLLRADYPPSTLVLTLPRMARAQPQDFSAWFAQFLPGVSNRQPAALFEPATVSDRTDGKIAHLDGLNLSRSWCWRSIAPALPAEKSAIAEAAADEHLAAALPHIAGDYMGEHWLASFALLAFLSHEQHAAAMIL